MIAQSTFRTFQALGGTVTIQAAGEGAEAAVTAAEQAVREVHSRLTRFEAGSELSMLNADPRPKVPASPLMIRFAEAVGFAGELSEGLVDATLLDEIENAGYTGHIDPDDESIGTPERESACTDRNPAGADPRARWRSVTVDHITGSVLRDPGVRLDSGGIGKGLAADVASEKLAHLDQFAVECSGDLRFGSPGGRARPVRVSSPYRGQAPVAELMLADSAIATSGTTRRSWLDQEGNRRHHLIDPRSGAPASTGVIQATAVAPTAVEAEVRAKAALLSGPDQAGGWLVHGGVIVLEGGRTITVNPPVAGGQVG